MKPKKPRSMVWPALPELFRRRAAIAKTATVAAACDTRNSKKKCLMSENDASFGETTKATFRGESLNLGNISVAVDYVALALESGKK